MSFWASWAGTQPVVIWYIHCRFLRIIFLVESSVFWIESTMYISQMIFSKDIKSHFLGQYEATLETKQDCCCGHCFSFVFFFPTKLRTLKTLLLFSLLTAFHSPSSSQEHVCFILRSRMYEIFQKHSWIEILFLKHPQLYDFT